MATLTPRPSPPAATPLPIQRYQVTEDDFKNPARFNVFISQLTGAVQALQGTGGPSVLPSGIDVQGATVSGLGAPKAPTDAISSGHAQGNFSAPVIGPQLDIGGEHALKGLTGLQMSANNLQAAVAAIQAALAAGATGTVPLAKITGGGANGSLTVTKGIITAIVNPT